jgi:hypothetical protein
VRYAVRFNGAPAQAAKAALEANGIPIISSGAWIPESSPGPSLEHHTAVGIHATTEADAVRHVRQVLAGHGVFSEFEAVRMANELG